MKRLTAVVACAALASACGGSVRVTRVVEGRVVEGRFVQPQAYALFLRGAIAESRGQLGEAIEAYETLARIDGWDAEVFARIAHARCARDPSDPAGKVAALQALDIDPDYGHALEAAAMCTEGRADATARAARAEPRNVDIQLSYARALEKSSKAREARDLLLAMTLEQPESAEAIGALITWADAHDDVALYALALASAARRAPRLDAVVARGAMSLAGEGQIAYAREVAAVWVDERARRGHGSAPVDEATRTALGRLAVDEAIGRADEDAVERRTVAAHLPTTEAAARAALAGKTSLAKGIALEVLHADPSDVGARMVLTALGERDSARAVLSGVPGDAPAAACLTLGQTLWRAAGATAARSALERARCAAIAGDDPPVLSVAVDLAARDVIDASLLPIEGSIELAWRRRVPLAPAASHAVDIRHDLLARAQTEPEAARTAEMAVKAARRGSTDPLVLASLVAIARARGQTIAELARVALTPPASPVLDAALIDALPVTAPESVRVRARFAGLAATPAERALVQARY